MDYRERIKLDEGYRTAVYLDTEGVPTVGWGHAFFGSNTPLPGTPFSKEQCQEFFEDDMQIVERHYVSVEEWFFRTYSADEHYCTLLSLDYIRRGVLKNMLFNLGIGKLIKFKKMWACIAKQDWIGAAREMLDSKWAGQVKGRADRLALMMELGRGYA